jgi:nitrate reductase gamma subunit
MNDSALFGIAPYVAAFILIVGALSRLSIERQQRCSSGRRVSMLARRPVTSVALIGIVATHVAMWTLPGGLLAWNQSVSRLITFEVLLFIVGVAAGIGVMTMIAGTLRSHADADADALPLRAHVSAVDIAFLGVLLVAIVSGLLMAARYRWASSWSAVTLTPYVHSLFALRPDVQLVALPYLIKLHVFSGIVLIALLPFTSLMSLLLAPAHRALDLLMSPIVTVATRQARRLGDWAHESGRNLMWPEEED